MGTTVAILQEGYDPVPIDYRDFVTVITHPAQIDEAIADLAGEVIQKFSEVDRSSESTDESILAKVHFGASSAENEITDLARSEEHTSELQSLMRTSYAVFCLNKKKHYNKYNNTNQHYMSEPQQHIHHILT